MPESTHVPALISVTRECAFRCLTGPWLSILSLSDTVDWGVHRGCLGHGLSPTHTQYGYSDPFPLTGELTCPLIHCQGCGKSEMGQENRLHGGQLTGMEERQEMSEVWERQAVSSNGVLSRDLDSGDQS